MSPMMSPAAYLSQEYGMTPEELTDINTIDCNLDDEHVSPDDKGTTWYRADIIGIVISLVSLCFVSFSMLSDKRVRTHPNYIISLICLCDAYTYC